MCASLLGNTVMFMSRITSAAETGTLVPECGFVEVDSLQSGWQEVGQYLRMEGRRTGRKGFLDISRIQHMLAQEES